ncbi:MAG TPA: acyltransferase [Stellaceae bacterium]|nr:acyltransferase [Stellaceae bacterium]
MTALLGLATLAAFVLLTGVGLRCLPGIARKVMGEDPPDRVTSLDGLRGLLALAVVIHHCIIFHSYLGDGVWRPPPDNFDNLLGQAAVALFFMVSAYLFWGRVVRRAGRLDWTHFFVGRAFRLAPMYYFTVAAFLVIVAVETDFTFRVPLSELAREIGAWLTFAFEGAPDVNGLGHSFTILSTLWTLKFEWLFYLLLPLLALLYRATRTSLAALALLLVLSQTGGGRDLFLFFVGGCVAVYILEAGSPLGNWKAGWAAAGAAGLVALAYFFHDARGWGPAILLLPVFVAALQARGPWAVLRWRPVRFLGHISYSVYLIHNPLVYVITGAIGARAYSTLGTIELYGVAVLIGMAVIAVSTATYIVVEAPFLHVGSGQGEMAATILSPIDRMRQSWNDRVRISRNP